MQQTGPRPTSHVVPVTSRLSHQDTEFIPRVQYFNKLKASARFNPTPHPGYRPPDRTDVWVSSQPVRPTLQPQLFHDGLTPRIHQEPAQSLPIESIRSSCIWLGRGIYEGQSNFQHRFKRKSRREHRPPSWSSHRHYDD